MDAEPPSADQCVGMENAAFPDSDQDAMEGSDPIVGEVISDFNGMNVDYTTPLVTLQDVGVYPVQARWCVAPILQKRSSCHGRWRRKQHVHDSKRRMKGLLHIRQHCLRLVGGQAVHDAVKLQVERRLR